MVTGAMTTSPPGPSIFDLKAIARPRRPAEWALIALLGLLAAVSVSRGLADALSHSQDMQWSPLVVFWRRHLEPYQAYIAAPRPPLFILSQAPNNLHLTFFVLAPLAWLDFGSAKLAWAIANIGFLAGAALLFRKASGVPRAGLVALGLAASTSARISIENGQLSLFCLFFCAAYLVAAPRNTALAAALSSLGAIKYSFGAPLFFQGRLTPTYVLAFAALPVAAVLYWSLRFHLDPLHALLLPARVSALSVGGEDGVGDVMMFVRRLGASPMLAYGLAGALLLAVAGLQRAFLPTDDRLALSAFYATLSLWLVYHRIYDFVFLAPAALVAVRSPLAPVRLGLLLGAAYFWFGFEALLDVGLLLDPLIDNLILLAMLGLIGWEMRASATTARS